MSLDHHWWPLQRTCVGRGQLGLIDHAHCLINLINKLIKISFISSSKSEERKGEKNMDTSSSPTAPTILVPASPGEGAEEKENGTITTFLVPFTNSFVSPPLSFPLSLDPSVTVLSTSPTPQGELALAGELGTTDKLLFVAKEHPTDTLRSMQELRDEEKLCDVTLLVQGVEIKAHKIVLAASSHYFRYRIML